MLRVDFPELEFNRVYVQHIQCFTGEKPAEKYFKTKARKCLPIDRFLSFGDLDLLSDRALKDLNVNVIMEELVDYTVAPRRRAGIEKTVCHDGKIPRNVELSSNSPGPLLAGRLE